MIVANVTCFDRPLIPPLARFPTGPHPGLANTEPQNLLFVSLGRRFFPPAPASSHGHFLLSSDLLILHPILYPLCDFWFSSFVCVSKRDHHLFYLLALSDFSLGEFSRRHPSTCTSDPLRPLLFVRIYPSHSLHHPPVSAILMVKNPRRRRRTEQRYRATSSSFCCQFPSVPSLQRNCR